MFKQFFWPKILTINTLGINVHKIYEWHKPSAQLPCKKFQKMKILGILGHWYNVAHIK
jgi:hypothetical protein